MNLNHNDLQDKMADNILKEIRNKDYWDNMSDDEKSDLEDSVKNNVKKITEPLIEYLNQYLINSILEDADFRDYFGMRNNNEGGS